MPAAQQKPDRTNDEPESSSGIGAQEFSEMTTDAISGIRDATSSVAERGAEAIANAGDAARRAGRSAKARASRIAEQAQSTGGEAVRTMRVEMSERPLAVALAAAAVAGVLGYLLGRRR